MHCQVFWDSCAQNNTSEISTNALSGILGHVCAERNFRNLKNALSGILGLLCAEEDVGNLKKWTFRISGTPVRRTRRRKSQEIDFQEFWDSCAQNKTSEVSKNGLSGILGLLCVEQDVGNLKKTDFQEFWDSCAQSKTSEISKTALSGSPDRYRCSCTAPQASGDQCSADDGGRPES